MSTVESGVSETGCPRLVVPYRLSSFGGEYRWVCGGMLRCEVGRVSVLQNRFVCAWVGWGGVYMWVGVGLWGVSALCLCRL